MDGLDSRGGPSGPEDARTDPTLAETKVIILAGGRGTRLAPYTSILPKPLMPIGDYSVLEVLIHRLERHGFRDIVLSVGYLSHLIRAVLDNSSNGNGGNGSDRPRITYVHEHTPLGTAGPLRSVDGIDETFIAMNGDVLTTLDLPELRRAHRESGNILTIATNVRTTRMDYGVIRIQPSEGGTDPVIGYIEKPEMTFMVSMGIYVLEPRVLEYIPADSYFDFPDLVEALLEEGEPVGAYCQDGLWFDIGRQDDYERAVAAWEKGELALYDPAEKNGSVEQRAGI